MSPPIETSISPTNAEIVVGKMMAFWRSLSPAELRLLKEAECYDIERSARIIEASKEVQ